MSIGQAAASLEEVTNAFEYQTTQKHWDFSELPLRRLVSSSEGRLRLFLISLSVGKFSAIMSRDAAFLTIAGSDYPHREPAMKRRNRDRGASLVEYALMIAFISIVTLVSIRAVGGRTYMVFTSATEAGAGSLDDGGSTEPVP